MATMNRARCNQCAHLRTAKSTVQAAFQLAPGLVQPDLIQVRTRQLENEGNKAGGFVDESQTSVDAGIDTFTSRPSVPNFTYCGLGEFDGVYYIPEAKNPSGECGDFRQRTPGIAAQHCKTCKHLRLPAVPLLSTLERVFISKNNGQQQFDALVKPMLKARAEAEFTDCCESGGLVPGRPGYFPVCDARSQPEASLWVVGPLVNVSSQCERWEAGAVTETWPDELRRLLERMDRAVTLNLSGRVKDDVTANAEADVIDFCLSQLGYDRDYVDAMCSRYTRSVWGKDRVPSFGAAPIDQIEQQTMFANSQVPFIVEPNQRYAHPLRPDIVLACAVYEGRVLVGVQVGANEMLPFDMTGQTPVWTQLNSPQGPLPISLMPGNVIYAMWM